MCKNLNQLNCKAMAKKSFFMALLVLAAVLGAKAQNNNVYKADTVIVGIS